MRVHEIAKELGVTSKDILVKAKELKIDAKSHMSAIDDAQVEKIKKKINAPKAPKLTPGKKAKASKALADKPKETPVPEKSAPIKNVEPLEEEIKPEVEKQEAEKSKPEKSAPEKPREIIIKGGAIIVKDFAEELELRPNQLIAELMSMNIFATINQNIDLKTAQQIGEKHGVMVETEKQKAKEQRAQIPVRTKKEIKKKKEEVGDPDAIRTRPPVVTFLGHVDHGKTSLLDRIRKSRVAKGEAGGITQHIGAYTIEYQGHEITFLDTPGHAAFTKMRARGANLTDIAIIVVAADDGIMEQTREAIQHAKAAEVAIMVAINKIDLPGANPDNVKSQLQQEGLASEDWGGDTICCLLSAETGEGIEELMEYINLQAEILEITANPHRKAKGFVIEAQLEKGRGPTATVLVKEGTLKVGDAVACGTSWGRIKALIDDRGKNIKSAGPAHAAKCMGLSEVPEAGVTFETYANDREARSVAEERKGTQRTQNLQQSETSAPMPTSIEEIFAQQSADEKLETQDFVLKADTQGSLEAIEHTLNDIPSDKVNINLVLKGIGNITDNDVQLARASNAVLIGFHVNTEGAAVKSAKHAGIQIKNFDIIYELIDEIIALMEGKLDPELKEQVLGRAEIKQIFSIGKKGNVAGCIVIRGKIISGSRVRVLRKKDIIFEGRISSLKRYQDDAREVRDGQECGIGLKNFYGILAGDIIEAFLLEEVSQRL